MRRTKLLVLVIALAAIGFVAVATALDRAAEARSPRAMAEAVREDVRTVRSSLDACLDRLDRLEAAFRTQERTTGSLRAQIDGLEAMDDRGVPAERYEEYLEAVEAFNESLPRWEERADSVRAHASRCRRLVTTHNTLADSLQRLVIDAGFWEGSAPGWPELAPERGEQDNDGTP